MSILDLGSVIFQPVSGIIMWMLNKHLLPSTLTSSACNVQMSISPRVDISDGCRYSLSA